MSVRRYDDVLATPRRRELRVVPADPGLVVEEVTTGFTGDVVACDAQTVTLRDRRDRKRVFPLVPAGFSIDGETVTLTRPRPAAPTAPARTRSGGIADPTARARVARGGRLWVEGKHDAELVEKVWGDDLRHVGVVVEPLDGVDDLPELVRQFAPQRDRRLGVLVDHLVAGSKESRLAAAATSPHVLVAGHPYVDVWQAVRPRALGIAAWPEVPRGRPWKEGVCAALGVAEPYQLWARILRSVGDYTDLETPLITSVERLIDFVTEDMGASGTED